MNLLLKKKRLIHYLGKSWVIALLLTLPVLFFIPFPSKYKTSVVSSDNGMHNKIFYDDLNDDGNSEKIEIRRYTPLKNIPSIFVEKNGKFFYEWITSGYVVEGESSTAGDYDHDGLKEVYLYTFSQDSVFLNGVVPFKKGVLINRKFLTCFQLYNGNNELSISKQVMTDLNGDGFNELVAFFFSAFTYTNRKVIAYDIKNDTILYSPKSAWGLYWDIALYDWDDDGLPEFTGGFPAWGNCTQPGYPYTDSIAWLMVLDNDLSFLFKPVPIGWYSSEVKVVPFKYGNTASLAVVYKQNGSNDSSFIALFSPAGALLKKKCIDIPWQQRISLFTDPDKDFRELYLLRKEKMVQLDSSFHVVRTINLKTVLPIYRLDVDGDGKKEYLARDMEQDRLVVYRNNFRYPAVIDIPLGSKPVYVSLIRRANAPAEIFLELIPDTYIISYQKNKLYFLLWVFTPLLVFSSFFLLIFGIERLQRARIRQRYEDEKRMIELQIKAIKNQIDPHFTLNMVTSIGALFMNKKPDEAYDVFTRYSRMLQTTITASDDVAITLDEELDYVKDYLEIQKFRFGNKFDFTIHIAKSIRPGKITVPRMLVYTFVENAVKHGIMPLNTKGYIDLDVVRENKKLVITVSDNGIGRDQAKKNPAFGTGKGLKILDEIIALFYKLEKTRIRYEIKDRDEGGTVAVIYIPQSAVGSR